MNDSAYIVRNYQPADFDRYVRLNIEAEKLEPGRYHVIAQVVAEKLARPNYSPREDLFVAEIDANIIGFLDITRNLDIGRVILDCWVHPEHRRRGLATRLFDSAMHRAEELGDRIAHVQIEEDNLVAKSVLDRLGFAFVRRFLELRLDMAEMRWQDIEQLKHCHLKRGQEDKLVWIQNRAFAGTWGYNPNTVEEIIYYTNLLNRSPEDVILACDGDKVAGYCWTEIAHQMKMNRGEKKGRILMIGTDPDYRGGGVGKMVLLAGLDYLRSKGLRFAELTVDSENKAACALYFSVGFEPLFSTLWYEKLIR